MAFADIAAVVSASDFTTDLHRKIFGAMSAMDAAKQPIDLVTVAEWLEAKGALQDGDWAYIGASVRDTPSAANVLSYARIVRDRARQPGAGAVRNRVAGLGLSRRRRGKVALKPASNSNAWTAAMSRAGWCRCGRSCRTASVSSTSGSRNRPKGSAPGCFDLDGLLHGLQAGKLYVIAGH